MSDQAIRLAGAVVASAVESSHLSPDEVGFFKTYQPAGLTFFRRNIPQPFSRLQGLSQSVQTLASDPDLPMVICIDQEGGRVARIAAPFPNQGPCLDVMQGLALDEQTPFMEAYGFSVGQVLKGLGINVNFAPVVDILTNEDNDAIGDRVFGRQSQQVISGAGGFLNGLSLAGVNGCLKHFPGQGDANFDTHKTAVSIGCDLDELWQRELKPFAALCQQAPMVMISHCIYPCIDSKPAGLSQAMIQGLLRGELGYQGVVVSDDMNMHALPQDDQAWVDCVIAGVAAGVDLVLVCRHFERSRLAIEGLAKEARSSSSFFQRLQDASQRMYQLRRGIASKTA